MICLILKIINITTIKRICQKTTQDLLIPIFISIEYEISTLNPKDKQIFLKDLIIKETGLDSLIKATNKS